MAQNAVQDVTDEVQDKAKDVTGNGAGDLGKKILIPAAAGLGTLAVTYAARKVPDLLNERVKPALAEKGSEEAAKIGKEAAKKLPQKLQEGGGPMGKVAGKAMEKLGGGGGGGGGGKKTRRLPIQRWTDVAAPIDVVYDKWTNFEEFPKFMHRVLTVEKKDEKKDGTKDGNKISWSEKIWFSKREWEALITEQKKNERIAWKTTQGTSHIGVITFHKLDNGLTRVMVDMDFRPTGMFEKMASGLRFVKRAVQADLARFKAYVELGQAKGLDYTQDATTESDSDDDEKDDDKKEEESGSNGQANEPRSEKSEDERDDERQERSQRRQQRRS